MREPPLPCPPHSFAEPAAAPAVRRALNVRPEHVRLAVRLDPREVAVEGTVAHTVRAIRDGVRRLTLDAVDIEVRGARADGASLPCVAHANGIDVELPRTLAADETFTFELDFAASPLLGLHFVGESESAQVWTQGAMEDHHHWFPCFDAPEHLVTTEVLATVPEPYLALSNGEMVTAPQAAEPGWRRFHWRHDTPHALYLLTLVVDRLTEVTDRWRDVTLHHYVPEGREDDARVLFERLPEMLDFFAAATGVPYPYPRYGHVFLREFMWGGMENTTLTSLTDQVLVPGEHRDQEDIERLWAHELAHQWFGDLIAPRGWPEIWLNESFATYFELLCMEALEGPDDFARRLVAQRDAYLDEARTRYARSVVERTYAHPYVLFDRHAYEKGCLVLHMLRDQVGDAAFTAGVRRYVREQAGRAADTNDLLRCLETESGVDLHGLFDDFVFRPGHPTVTVRWLYEPRGGLEVEVERTGGEQTLHVTLAIGAAEEVRRVRVRLTPETRTIVLPDVPPPSWVALDPEQACVLDVDESAEVDWALRARLGPETPTLLRMRTMRELGRRGLPPNTARIARSLNSDPSISVRIEAAKALGAHQNERAREALLAVIASDADWRVRQAAGEAVGRGADAGLVERLADLLAAESLHRVRCGLLAGLGHINDPAARAVVRKYLDQPSTRGAVAEAALKALAAQEDPEVIDELVLRSAAGHPPKVRRAAIAGLGRLARAEGVKDEARRRIRQELEGLLGDDLFHVRYAAVEALKRVAEARSKPALERAHGAERFAILRRVIREALGALEHEG